MVKRETAATIMLANPSLPPRGPILCADSRIVSGRSRRVSGEGCVFVGGGGGQAPPYVG